MRGYRNKHIRIIHLMQKGVEHMEERILSEVITFGLLLVMGKRHFMINSEVFLIIHPKYSIAGIISRSSDMISWEKRVSDSLQGLTGSVQESPILPQKARQVSVM